MCLQFLPISERGRRGVEVEGDPTRTCPPKSIKRFFGPDNVVAPNLYAEFGIAVNRRNGMQETRTDENESVLRVIYDIF
ncbi:unnamed protein product [Gordionus sp. m RMFG-2023]